MTDTMVITIVARVNGDGCGISGYFVAEQTVSWKRLPDLASLM
jgi:hypothetical protein